MPRSSLVRLPFLVLGGCGEPAPPPPTPEATARRVCELAKPACDVVAADFARTGETSGYEPLTRIEGLEGMWKGIVMASQYEGDAPADILHEDVEGEPSARYTFEDLDLTCWPYDEGGSIQGARFTGGWLILRVLSSQDGVRGARGEPRHAVTYAMIHARRIGDVVWAPPR